MRNLATLLLSLFLGLGVSSGCLAVDGRLRMEGADPVLSLDDGRVLRREALVGLTLKLASSAGETEVRIDAVAIEEAAPGGPIPLFTLSAHRPGEPAANICRPDPKGPSWRSEPSTSCPTGSGRSPSRSRPV